MYELRASFNTRAISSTHTSYLPTIQQCPPHHLRKNRRSRPPRHTQQNRTANDENGKSPPNIIPQALHEAVHNPQPNVRPREIQIRLRDCRRTAGHAVLRQQRHHETDGVELRRLLHQVVVVVGGPAHAGRDLGVEVLGRHGVDGGGLEAGWDIGFSMDSIVWRENGACVA